MGKHQITKLELHRETVRHLQPRDLTAIAGGALPVLSIIASIASISSASSLVSIAVTNTVACPQSGQACAPKHMQSLVASVHYCPTVHCTQACQ
ncbi:MAG: hypothetical protein HJJLKODD_02467 [Phycisphaerae bacterium]|nr:hypothetical protein [Phycisphaerae bacterium]